MKDLRRQIKVTSGVFISKEVLSEANICGEDIEIELEDGEVRIHPIRRESEKKLFTLDSPLWKCVGFAEADGISGRNHDKYIYDEK